MKKIDQLLNRGEGRIKMMKVKEVKGNGNIQESIIGHEEFEYNEKTTIRDIVRSSISFYTQAQTDGYKSNHVKFLSFFKLGDIPKHIKEQIDASISFPTSLQKEETNNENQRKKTLIFVQIRTKSDRRNHIEISDQMVNTFEYTYDTSIIEVMTTARDWYARALWNGVESNHRKLLEIFNIAESTIETLEREVERAYDRAVDRY